MGQTRYVEEMVEIEVDEEEDPEIELVVQGRTIAVSEKLLCQHSVYFRNIFLDFDENQETMILKHSKGSSGEVIPEERQQEPLALINFTTMITIVEFIHTNKLQINDQVSSPGLSYSNLSSECQTAALRLRSSLDGKR